MPFKNRKDQKGNRQRRESELDDERASTMNIVGKAHEVTDNSKQAKALGEAHKLLVIAS